MHSVVQVTTPATSYDLTTVELANQFLGLEPSTAGDAILAGQITAASKIIASVCDRIFGAETVDQTFVMRIGECIEALNLQRVPVISIASISDGGQMLAPGDYDYDPAVGIVWRVNPFFYGAWPLPGSKRVTVSYVGGYMLPDDAPEDLTLACHALIKEQRFAQLRGDPTIRSLEHGDARIFFQQGSTAYTTGQGALPPAVSQLIAPYKYPAAA